MIKVFYGENRKLAGEQVKKFLGDDYEVMEGAEMGAEDLVNVFFGATLFSKERKILVRDLLTNKAAQSELERYLESPHKVALLELKVDKRSSVYKALKDKVEWVECKMPQSAEAKAVFDIFAVAKRDGKRAVEMLKKIEMTQDPIMFEGLMVAQALKDYQARGGAKEKMVLKRLAELDMKLKTAGMEPWILIESFLLGLSLG